VSIEKGCGRGRCVLTSVGGESDGSSSPVFACQSLYSFRPMTTNDGVGRSSFGCHVADSDVAPGLAVSQGNEWWGEGCEDLPRLANPCPIRSFIVPCVCSHSPRDFGSMTTNDKVGRSSFGCHVAVGDVAPRLTVS
jgi:hypothetical protein